MNNFKKTYISTVLFLLEKEQNNIVVSSHINKKDDSLLLKILHELSFHMKYMKQAFGELQNFV